MHQKTTQQRPGPVPGKREKTMNNELNNIKSLAAKFLAIADELNEKVSAYLNGSTAKEAEEAYEKVIATEVEFTKAANAYYGESWKPCLNYELAESFLY